MSNRDRLVGAWRLVEWRTDYADGRAPTLPFGERPEGLLVYSADGWMNASIGRAARPRMTGESLKHAPEAERLRAIDTFMSYGGPFEVRGDEVQHHVVIALYPNLVGTEQIRTMRFAGDTLTLSARDTLPGTTIGRTHSLVWRRAEAR
jgi:hypothetical protein